MAGVTQFYVVKGLQRQKKDKGGHRTEPAKNSTGQGRTSNILTMVCTVEISELACFIVVITCCIIWMSLYGQHHDIERGVLKNV